MNCFTNHAKFFSKEEMAALMGAVRANAAAGMKPADAQMAAVEGALAEARADLQEVSQAVADARPAVPKSGMDAAAEAMKESAAAIREMAAAVSAAAKPVPQETEAQALYNSPSRKFLRLVNSLGGIKSSGSVLGGAHDVLGEQNAINLGGMAGRIFKKDGNGIDYMATLLHERNWLTDEEYGSTDGGTQRVKDMILDAVNDRLEPVLEADIQKQMERDQLARALADEAPRPENWDTLTDGEKDDELDRLFGEDTRAASGDAEAGSHVSQEQLEYALTGETPEQLRVREARLAAERAQQAQLEKAPSPDSFTLTGSDRTADQGAAAGQGSLFQPKPEYGIETLYRGEYTGNKGGQFFSPDREWARQFTQSGQDHEIKSIGVKTSEIFEPKAPVYAGDPDAVDVAISEARGAGFKAVRLDEGNGQPNSVLVFNKTAIKSAPVSEQPKPAYNPAQLDLIYDHTETRPGTTPEQKSTGIAALRALFGGDRRAGASVLGSALWKSFQARAGSELIGQKAESSADLALAAQVLRDPRFETLRVFFTQNGKIVGHTGWTSRLPGGVAFDVPGRTGAKSQQMSFEKWNEVRATWNEPEGTREDYNALIRNDMLHQDGYQQRLGQLRAQMQATGADGYYLLHNHPSGSAKPSYADLTLTQHVAKELPGFKGHVVIDHNEYSQINAYGDSVTKDIPEGHRQKTAEPELMHDLLFDTIHGPKQLVAVGKKLQAKSGYVTLISTNAVNEIIAIAEAPEELLRGGTPYKDLKAMARIRRFQVMSGSAGRVFLVASNNPAQFENLVKRGAVSDVVSTYGSDTLREATPMAALRDHADFGHDIKMVAEAQQTVAPYWTQGLTPEQQAALQKTGSIREEQTLGERIKEMTATFSKSFKQGLFDQFEPLKQLGYRQYMLARMSKATDGGLEAMMMYGKLFLDGGALNVRKEDGGLIGVFQKLNGEHDRFLNWIAGNRAAQLKAEGRENLLTNVDITALKDLNQGRMSDGQDRATLYTAIHKEFNAYMKSVLDIAEQQGLIDKESRAIWEKEFYVPFYRNMEDGTSGPTVKSGMVGQYAFQKLKGGTDNMKDLMGNTLMNWSHLLSASMKNKAALTALETAVQVGGAIEVSSTHMAKQMQLGTDVVKVLDEGVHRYFMVADPFMLDAITAMEWSGFKGPVMEAMGKFKRALSVGVTVNPTYKIRNLMRDTVSAIAQGDLSYNAAKNLAQGWRLTATDNPVRASMMAGGALMRFGAALEGDSAARTKRLIDAGVDQNTVLDTPGKVKAMMEKAWTAYQELGDRGEQVNRAALYQQLRDRGLSHLEASFQARDLMDFSMQGKSATIRMLTQAVPFMNARLQGLYKLGRATAEDPARMGYVVGALALASMSMLLWNHDDDDWKKREDWDRDQYWWFKVGDTAYRVPKPFEIGAVASVAERALEWAISDERDPGHRFLKSIGNMISNNLSMNPTPQMVKPLIDLYANQDSFTGRKIETEGMQNLSKGERVGPGTSLPAQLLGKLDPTDSLSPVQIDFLARAYFGWLGTAAVTAVDYGMRPLTDLPPKPAAQLRQFPVIGNFMEGLPANQSRYVTLFYDEAKRIDEAYADYRNALKLGDREKAADLMADKGGLIRQESHTARARRAIGVLNQQERMVELNRELDPAAKRVLVDAIAKKRDELARSVVTR